MKNLNEMSINEAAEMNYPTSNPRLQEPLVYNYSDVSQFQRDAFKAGAKHQARQQPALDELEQWCYNEICERREYSASKTYEGVVDKIKEIKANSYAKQQPVRKTLDEVKDEIKRLIEKEIPKKQRTSEKRWDDHDVCEVIYGFLVNYNSKGEQ